MSGTTQQTYGLTPQGFVRMRLPEITDEIRSTIETLTGVKWNFGEDSFIGLLVSVFADREAQLWELLETIHLWTYPSGAQGVALDNAVSFSGVRRRFDTPTLVLALLYGTPGTTIPAGSLARTTPVDGTVQKTFALQADLTINESSAASATYELLAAPAGVEYYLSISGVKYSWVAVGANATDSAAAFANVLATAGLDVKQAGARITVTAPLGTTYGLIASPNIQLITVAGVGTFASTLLGPVPLAATELNSIVTNVIGWSRVTNPAEGKIGLVAETDDAVLERYSRGVYQLGGGTVPAIQANLEKNVVGVTAVQVYENVLDFPDNFGRPPHSIEVVIEGGLDQDIANELYRVKGGGIVTFGAVTMQVRGSTGALQPIRFNRPAPVYIWAIIDIALYPEESLASDATIRIREAVAAAVNNLPTGKDVLAQRLLAPVFAASPGIARANIRMASVPTANLQPSPSSYLVNDVAVSPRQRAKTSIGLIQVNIL